MRYALNLSDADCSVYTKKSSSDTNNCEMLLIHYGHSPEMEQSCFTYANLYNETNAF